MTPRTASAGVREQELDRDVVAVRRRLHQHAELRFAEFETAAIVAEALEPHVDRLSTGVAGTGLIATIETGEPGPRVLLRADMDAYPVAEGRDHSFASLDPSVSHACGHDVHMAVMIGVARRLAASRPARGGVDVLFQPAEEIPFGADSGAMSVLTSGRLSSRYDAVLGLHCWPELPAGTIGVNERISMAAKDAFRVRVAGRGAHAATPAAGRDALLAMSAIVTALHLMVARLHDPHERVAFNVGTIEGGASQSALPERVTATGTLRTDAGAVRSRLKLAIEEACAGSAIAYGVDVELEWANEMPPVVNDADLVDLARSVVPKVARLEMMSGSPMTSDDFALLGERWPALYVKLGISDGGDEPAAPLHSSRFDVDEECLRTGIRTIEHLTRAALTLERTRIRD